MHFLDKVQLAFECPLRWEKLTGDEARRFCGRCEKHVHNLSAMSRRDAEKLLADTETPICVRVEIDAVGRAVHRPPVPALVMAVALTACAAAAEGDSVGMDSALDSGFIADTATMDASGGGGFQSRGGGTVIPEVQTSTRTGATDTTIGGGDADSDDEDSDRDTSDRAKRHLMGAPRPLMGKPARPTVMLGEPMPVMGLMVETK